jgi:hypothetical protein
MSIADALSASREQLSSIARATAYAMIGYAINTAVGFLGTNRWPAAFLVGRTIVRLERPCGRPCR